MSAPEVAKRAGRIGERLVARGCLTDAQLQLALKEQRRTGGRLGEIISLLGFATESEIASALASQAGVEEVSLSRLNVSPVALALLDESFCREYALVPIDAGSRSIRVAMANSFDIVAVDLVAQKTGRSVDVVAATESDVAEAIDRLYGDEAGRSVEELVAKALAGAASESDPVGGVDAQPIVQLANAILRDAVRADATDIHIEPDARVVRTRLRVDGLLVSALTLPKALQSPIVARLKLMARLDISETRLPQDGKIETQIDRRTIGMRVSTLPTIHGENVVVRILDKSRVVLGLTDIGFSKPALVAFTKAIRRPSGIILVTGPTGSGKTTTLYAALNELNAITSKIATLEDPVEYELPVIRQSQVNVQAGLTFSKGLRSLLRQDPDIVLVGEMRDAETAEVALRAAMTGHLVLSTLHTNTAIGAVHRLENMGIEPYLLASTLVASVAQRLVRRLCPSCRRPDDRPEPAHCEVLGLPKETWAQLWTAPGCDACSGTGYVGRRAIAEVMTVTPAVAKGIAKGGDMSVLKGAALAGGMVPIAEEARQLALSGESSVAEIMRHIWDLDH